MGVPPLLRDISPDTGGQVVKGRLGVIVQAQELKVVIAQLVGYITVLVNELLKVAYRIRRVEDLVEQSLQTIDIGIRFHASALCDKLKNTFRTY